VTDVIRPSILENDVESKQHTGVNIYMHSQISSDPYYPFVVQPHLHHETGQTMWKVWNIQKGVPITPELHTYSSAEAYAKIKFEETKE